MTDTSSNAQEALFVVLLAMFKQLVITIKVFPAKAALWMSLETSGLGRVLVGLSRVSVLEMLVKLTGCHQVVFVRKDLLVPDAKVAIKTW